MAGLTPTGFTAKTIEEIKAEVEADFLALVDPALDLSPDQPFGQIVGIVAQREAKLWELLAVAYGGADPRAAESFLLDGVAAITGTVRAGETKSRVFADCNVNAAFSALAGTMFCNPTSSPGSVFTNVAAVGPLAAGVYSIEFVATAFGPIVANAGTLTVITSPVSGWNSVTNPTDAQVGAAQESDASLRAKRENELSAAGACTNDALRADLLRIEHVDGVRPITQAFVFENTSKVTDANGLPSKSFEAVIFDGISPLATDAEVAKVIWGSKPSGLESYGTTSVNIVDSTGTTRIVKFSRATIKNVWLEADVSVDVNAFPLTGTTLVKDAIVALGKSHQNLGIDVVSAKTKSWALTVPGVLDVTALRLGFAVSPVGTANLVITGREIANFDTSRITVASTPGTP